MANATAKVPMATVAWGDDKIARPLKATAQTWYPGAMVARGSDGYLVKCDNTAGIVFDGLNAETVRIVVASGEADGDRELKVERPFRFVMTIASAALGDEGKAVYASFDNLVAYSTTNSIQVGWVDQVLSATSVLIRPMWAGVNGTANFDGNTLAFTGATTVNQITMPDNLADALSISQGSNEYLTFVSTDASEAILVKKTLRLDAINVSTDTTTGTKIGTATTQKIGFFNATPIVQVANTVDYLAGLVNLGLRASGGTAAAAFPGSVTSSAPTGGGIGYATGAGGAVSQATDRTTGVTLNKLCGQITTQATSLAAAALVSFTVTNSTVAIGDTVDLSIQSGPTTVGTIAYVTTVAAGSFQITLKNGHASTADTGAAILNFAVTKAVSA